MCAVLRSHGTSVSAIAHSLNYTRSDKQVLQKLINIKKWPKGIPADIIEIIENGRLSIKT